MVSVAFDTLKLAQGLEGAGVPPKQAQDSARAIADAIVTHEYPDLRIGDTRREIADCAPR